MQNCFMLFSGFELFQGLILRIMCFKLVEKPASSKAAIDLTQSTPRVMSMTIGRYVAGKVLV